ncbi:MAG: AAA domain-containing protein [Candidatus Heimdallarchaeaceae archaeon]
MENLDCVYLKTLSQKDGTNPLSTVLIDVNKEHFILNLWSPWHEIGEYLEPYTPLKLYNVDTVEDDDSFFYSAGSKSIVVVDPDILLHATAMNSVSFCPRSFYINTIVGETISPYIAVRGSIIHDCLSLAITNNSTPSQQLSNVLDSFSLQYEYHNYNKETVYQDVHKMAESLDSFVSELPSDSYPEMLFLSPFFGIRGRIDLFSNGHIYELKTGKVSEENEIRFSDLLQVSLYRYGLQTYVNETDPDGGTVIYVGTNKAVRKAANPNWGLLRYGMEKRNLAYRISYLGYVPLILPESEQKRCRNCFVKHYCALICAGLYQERRCSTCPHDQLCTKNALPDSYQEYFNNFSKLIRFEKNESARNLSDLWKLNVDQRKVKGKAISDLKLENEIVDGTLNRLLFSCKNTSELREGDIVVLSKGNLIQGFVSTGVISNITNTSIEVETRSSSADISVIDLYSIDVGYRRQQRGLFNIIFKRNNFRELIVEEKESIIKLSEGKYIPSNPIQNEAVEKIIGTQNYTLIQGPAGTGKTYVIAKSAIELAKKGEKILLTAFTNRAVDNICKYLLENGFEKFIRLGSMHSIQPEIRDYTLKTYKDRTPDKSISDILGDFPIIVATTTTISNPVFEKLGIQTIIIDEASQMTEPTILSALLEGNRFVLVVDHKQLPPVVQSPKAQKEGMSVSLFERLASKDPESVHLLTHQFRMNEKLIEFSNNKFYNDKLKSFDDLVKLQNLKELTNYSGDFSKLDDSEIYDPKSSLIFIQVSGLFNPEKKLNSIEAQKVKEVLNNFLKLGIKIDQVGIICPYRGQVGEIRRLIPANIAVDTVDRFQGSDRELVILSLTESKTKSSRGFADERRLNVAITRAKKKLLVIGDSNIQEGVLGSYVDYLNNKASVIKTKQKIEEEISPAKEIIIVAENISKTAQMMKKVVIKGKELIADKDETQKCMVCLEPVYENAVECPFCEHLFHFKHLVSWIEENERCPYCKTVLRIFR